MAISLANITGVVLNGFTAPVWNTTADTPPPGVAKQVIVSSIGGTATGVRTHSLSDPFTISVIRGPVAPFPKLVNGVLGRLGRNKTQVKLRKGTIPLAGEASQVSEIDITANIVSGAEVNDKANLAAMWSAIGALANREAANLLDTTQTGNV